VANLNTRIGKPLMPRSVPDFAGAIKGKRTIQSLRDACDTELARCKITANEAADKIQINLNTLTELAGDHRALFADAAQLVLKDNDAVAAIIKQRVAEHLAAEAAKEEATRQRIRAEEEARAAAKVKAEQEEVERESMRLAQQMHDDDLAASLNRQQAADALAAVKAGSPMLQEITKPEDDEPAIWRNAKQSVVVMLDGLTISELQEVANFIGRKAWRRAA